jgi:hypothetical protein
MDNSWHSGARSPTLLIVSTMGFSERATEETDMLRIFKMSSARVLAVLLVAGSLTTVAAGQASSSAATSSAVPRLVKFSGVVKDEQGRPQSGVAGITFALYKEQSGGAPLWLETQNVQADSSGRYTVLLGSSKADGLPMDLFTSGDARWIGVHPSGQAEQPRVLLVSTPYALKAADAETLGGLPVSAFALAAPANSNAAPTASSTPDATAASAPPPASSVTGSGTANYLPLWTSTSNIGNSVLFQLGSGSTAKLGIGTTTPSSTLDVKGSATLEGPVTIPPISGANATKGESSQAVAFVASSYDSSTRAPLSQTFVWKAEPINNNTPNPSGTLSLLFGAGTSTPTETGLKLSSKGIYTFASGQTFPGTGTITGVTTGSGSGLTGGGTTGNLNLSLTSTCSNGQVLQWNGTQWVCVSAGMGTITGVLAGTDLTGGGTTNSVTLNLDVTKTDARYPRLNTANTFTGNQSVIGNLVASGTVSGGTGSFGSLAVSSSLQVANLNASLLGGLSAGSYATTGANTFTQTQTIAGNGLNAVVGDMGCLGPSAGIGFGNVSGCNYTILRDAFNNLVLNRPAGGYAIKFREGDGADEMVIATGGSVGIGTGSPLATLEVDSRGTDAGRFIGAASTSGSPGYGVVAYGGDDNSNIFAAHGGLGGFFNGGNSTNNQGFTGEGIWAGPGTSGGVVTGYAGYFNGDVNVVGQITAGVKDFKIDHPLDPANKYLYHSSVESSEMMNIYTGNITTDSQGDAAIQLPEWFETLNGDFRYQLTVIGQFAQAIVASKIANNEFHIKTDKSNVEVSWQVTGVRQDAYAKAHPLQVEVGKSERERGFYIHPELYGAPEEKGMEWARHPEMMKQMKERRQKTNERQPKPNQRSK